MREAIVVNLLSIFLEKEKEQKDEVEKEDNILEEKQLMKS